MCCSGLTKNNKKKQAFAINCKTRRRELVFDKIVKLTLFGISYL